MLQMLLLVYFFVLCVSAGYGGYGGYYGGYPMMGGYGYPMYGGYPGELILM